MKKLLIVAAGVAGYVLGARAGRERYEQIRTQSQKVWNSPTVQSGVDHAADAAKSAASAAGSAATSAASTAGHKVTEAVADAVRGDEEGDQPDVEPDDTIPSDAVTPPQVDDVPVGVDAPEVDGDDVPASPAVTTPPTASEILDAERGRP